MQVSLRAYNRVKLLVFNNSICRIINLLILTTRTIYTTVITFFFQNGGRRPLVFQNKKNIDDIVLLRVGAA
jgi:hypothetical protein